MHQDRWQRIEDIFKQAVALPPADRQKFVEKTCKGDAELCREILELLEADTAEENFLDEQVFSLGARFLDADDFLVKESEFAFYRIQKLLGRGGMGAVYLAEDRRLERPVALKILPASLGADIEAVQRFRQEARTASVISHPNVAHIYEFGEENERYFLAMEYVEGKTLRVLIKEEKIEIARALDIVLQIAEALAATHQRGIVHRDIKPENVIVTENGLIKVLDFGVAKLLDFHTPDRFTISPKTSLINTTPGTIMGTISYIAPEQLQNKKIDFRADIWSVGIVLYEMLAGRKPFEGKTPEEIGKAILSKKTPPISLSTIGDKEETALKNIIFKTLNKSTSKRYQSAGDLAKDLKELKQNLELACQMSSGKLSAVKFLTDNSSGTNEQTQGLTFLTKSQKFWRGQSFLGKTLLLAVLTSLLTFGFGIAAQYFSRKEESIKNNSSLPKITHLTQDGRIKDAAISADGQYLAYVPIESERQSLWIRDLKNGSERQLLPPELVRYWGMRFTPNGERIFYVKTQPDGSISSLYQIPVSGGQAVKVVSNIANPPAVSPDGSKIAFIRTDPVKHRDVLLIADIDGSAEREIASRQFPDTFPSSSASWSPDGKLIALGAGRNGGNENAMVAIPAESGETIELTPWRWAAYGGAAWESDGRGLVFSAREKGSRNLRIWRLSYPDGEIRNLTDDVNAYEEVTLSESPENTIVTARTYEVSDIWSVNSSGSTRRLTTQGGEGADGLTVTPAGQIVYTQGEYEQSFLWRMNKDGSDRQLLAKNTGFLPSASRDGRFIAYVSTEGGISHIWLTETDGSNNKQLTNGDGENSPSFTPDGNWVIYTALGKESSTLWKISTDGEEKRFQLTFEGFTIKPQVSPDGTMIACTHRKTKNDEWKIVVLPVSGGQPLKIFDLPNPRSQMIRWTSDNRALIYINKQNGAQNLWRQPLDGDSPEQITYFTEDQVLHHDSLVDGSEIILSRGGRRRDIAMIKKYK
jgi:serine/threonine protein kinase